MSDSADKRSVSTDALETLGTIIDERQGRDAIHLAVENVEAGEHLRAGMDVCLVNGKAFRAGGKLVGIVDPFLKVMVNPGQRFWLVVYPRQITSLRHVWSHPDFPDTGEVKAIKDEAQIDIEDIVPPGAGRVKPSTKAYSEFWLREFCRTHDAPSYETLMQAIAAGDDWSGEFLFIDGEDAHGEIPSEVYDHYEVVTGRKAPARPKHFSCSC